MSAVSEAFGDDRLRRMWAGQPECCRDVTTTPKNLGRVKSSAVSEAVCAAGCHRIVEVPGARVVYDRRTGSAQPVWTGATR